MTDYTLGSRLSYYWLFPDRLDVDFSNEIGARRARFSPEKAIASYLRDMDLFASQARSLLRPGGFLAIVLAAPTAAAFKHRDVLGDVDDILAAHDLAKVWDRWRPIFWARHRNASLKRERVAVYRSSPP